MIKIFGFIFLILFSQSVFATHFNCPNRISFGPDFFYRDYSEKDLPTNGKSDERGLLYGFDVEYEYVKAQSFYFGADFGIAVGKTVYDGSLINLGTGEITPYKNHTYNGFLNAEARAGYTFNSSKWLITPFTGIGYHYWYRGSAPENPYGYDEEYQWPYMCLGFRTEYDYSNNLTFGCTLKTMYMFHGIMESSDLDGTIFHLGSEIQYEAQFPIIYRLDKPYETIDCIKLTPYYKNQNIGRSDDKIVEISGIPMIVHEPRSVTHVFGITLEILHLF